MLMFRSSQHRLRGVFRLSVSFGAALPSRSPFFFLRKPQNRPRLGRGKEPQPRRRRSRRRRRRRRERRRGLRGRIRRSSVVVITAKTSMLPFSDNSGVVQSRYSRVERQHKQIDQTPCLLPFWDYVQAPRS